MAKQTAANSKFLATVKGCFSLDGRVAPDLKMRYSRVVEFVNQGDYRQAAALILRFTTLEYRAERIKELEAIMPQTDAGWSAAYVVLPK